MSSGKGPDLIVVDSSVLVDAFAVDTVDGERMRERLEAEDQLHAPHLADLEVASAFRRMERGQEIPASRAVAALNDFGLLFMTRYEHGPLLGRVWELRDNVNPYDAVYVALAEALGCPLLTADARLAKVRSVRCPVEILGWP